MPLKSNYLQYTQIQNNSPFPICIDKLPAICISLHSHDEEICVMEFKKVMKQILVKWNTIPIITLYYQIFSNKL